MTDPRDKKFYQIQKKAQTTLENLTPEELRTYLSYSTRMMDYVKDKKSRKGWYELRKRILEQIEKQPNQSSEPA